MSSDLLSPPSRATSSSSPSAPSPRASLRSGEKAALLRLSPAPRATSAHSATTAARHLRKLSQVAMRDHHLSEHCNKEADGQAARPATSTGQLTIQTDDTNSYAGTRTEHKVTVPVCFTSNLSSSSSTSSHQPYQTKSTPSTIHKPRPSKTNVPIDTITVEMADAADCTRMTAQALANMEANMRRISEESASPTVKSEHAGSVAGGMSSNGSFSLSLDDISRHHLTRHREEDSSHNHTPIPIIDFSHSPSPSDIVSLSPMSKSLSSQAPGPPPQQHRSDSLHAPTFSLSLAMDSTFKLLSPSNMSSGWDPDADVEVDMAPIVTVPVVTTPPAPQVIVHHCDPKSEPMPDRMAVQEPEPEAEPEADQDSELVSPKSRKKKKTAAWKFWKKQPKQEAEDHPMMDTSSTIPITAAPMVATTLPSALPSRTVSAPTIGVRANTLPAAVLVSCSSPPAPATVTSPVPALLLSPPKPSTPKNKLSPRGGSKGRDGMHKRQKSARGDDVHSPRARHPAASTKGDVAPGRIVPPATTSPAITRKRSGSVTARAPGSSAQPASSNNRGSVTTRGDRPKATPKAPAEMDADAIMASLIWSGLMGGGSDAPDDSPEPARPANSYVDSVYELRDAPPQIKRPYPKTTRPVPIISSWTRTTCVPHLSPHRLASPPPSSGALSPRRAPAPVMLPPRSASVIVGGSPPSSSNPTSPCLSPLLQPMQPPSSSHNAAPSELRRLISGHSLGYLYFLRHLQREYASESLLFWRAAEDFLGLAAKEMQAEAEGLRDAEAAASGFSLVYLALYDMFLRQGAKCEINISSSLRELLKKDATAHEAHRAAFLLSVANSAEPQVQRNLEALNQTSLINLERIRQESDEQLEGATLVVNPIAALGPNVKKTAHQPQGSISDFHLDEMKLDGDVAPPAHPKPVTAGSTTATLALSTYTHLLQSQAEIEKLLSHDCLPRFKNSPLYEKWRKVQAANEPTIQSLGNDNYTLLKLQSGGSTPVTSPLSASPLTLPPLSDKRMSCLLPTSVASSFSNLAGGGVPNAPPMALVSAYSCPILSRASSCESNGATISGSPVGGVSMLGCGLASDSDASSAALNLGFAPTSRSLTVGASVFAQAAAAATVSAAARTRATTTHAIAHAASL